MGVISRSAKTKRAGDLRKSIMRTNLEALIGILVIGAAIGNSSDLAAEEISESFRVLVQQARQLERNHAAADRNPLTTANIRCEEWHAIGPFKDAEYGVFAREFGTEFPVEKDVLALGSQPAALGKVYGSMPVPGALDSQRHWISHPDWQDGYYNHLPSGPPPARNEVLYLYRTIRCDSAVEATSHLVTLDAAKAWLNGRLILDAPIRGGAGQRFLQAKFKIPLQTGENRLLIKIAKCFQKNGFSFAIEGLHPIHPALAGQPAFQESDPGANLPGLSLSIAEQSTPPAWYVRRSTWWETLLASRKAASEAGHQGILPYKSPVLRQKDGPQHIRIKVSGLKQMVLVCTTGGDNYDYDDSIWADPTLVAKDGQSIRLMDLRAAETKVGYLELFTNRNYTGKKLKIGEREFDGGFWAHAPSRLVYNLDGKFEWFDTWFGLDALATVSGTSEFIIAADSESARLAENEPAGEIGLQAMLQRDFPNPELQKEISRELSLGIWDGIRPDGQLGLVRERYRSAILRSLRLSVDSGISLPSDEAGLRTLFHQAAQFRESLEKLHCFRFAVEPLPTYEPPILAMQRALDQLEPSPGGAACLARLAPVRNQAQAALACDAEGQPGASEAVIQAAKAVDQFRADSIQAAGKLVFVRHPSFGRINAVDPYDTPGASPAAIAILDPATPGRLPRTIYEDQHGSVWQASLSFDGQTLFFAAKRAGVPGGWHIYEMGVDGKNLKQITEGLGNDIAPAELPSGQILFISNRAGNMNVCQANRAGAIYVCERDGTRVRRVSANTLSDHTPAVMDDGRIMFTRWDYGVDKGVFQRHGIWTMNPDGTRLQLFFGNTILDPNAFWQCVPVPGRPEVISTFGGHHAGPYGVVGLLWNRLGIEAPRGEGFRFLTPQYPTYFDGAFWSGYMDPFPLNEQEFLVSFGGENGRRNRLCLLDSRGNQTTIWEEAGNLGCYNPLALRARKRPPVIPMTSTPREFEYADPVVSGIRPDDASQGTFFLHDVYEGLQGHVRRGEIKNLQIMELVPKTHPHTGGYAWNISPTIGRGTFYVRRLIGLVPVEADGSAYFNAPALRDISFNALDAEGRVLQKMGSTTQIMPGERQSCTGCHAYEKPPSAQIARVPEAARRGPSSPNRPDWGTSGIIDYCLVVQPVWDRHCVRCHSGARPGGGLDLSGDKTRYFNLSYDMLIDRGFVHHIPQNGADQDLTTPKGNGSLASRLVREKYLEPVHHEVALGPEEFQRVYTWIDANVPYYHTYLYTDGGVNGARDRWYAKPGWASNDGLDKTWFQKDFAPVFMKRCFDCHKRTIEISDAWLGRTFVTVTSKVWSDITIMDQGLQIEGAVATFGPEYRINLSHPEWSQMLTAPLAREAGGLGLCRSPSGTPVFKNTADPDYQKMLQAIQAGQRMLSANPRVDMLPRPDPQHPEDYAASLQRPRILP